MKPWYRINMSRHECPNCGRRTYLFTSNKKYQCHLCGYGYRDDYEEMKIKKQAECISRTLMKECGCYPPDKKEAKPSP